MRCSSLRSVGALWRALTRPRSLHRAGRLTRPARGRRSGVALLLVITTVMLLTILVTELSYGAQVRFMVTTHEKDRVAAYWLARSGYNIYRLILVGNQELGKNSQVQSFAESMGISIGNALIDLVPVLNTGLLRMLMGSEGASDVSEEDVADFKQTGQVSEEVAKESREGGLFSDKNFLDFPGDFSAEVHDHESRINVNGFATGTEATQLTIYDSPTAKQLYALMSGEENDQWFQERNIDRWEIIGNLKDWVDSDSIRSAGSGGYEDSLYNALESPYLTKNAPFDTIEEIHQVAGWEGEIYDRFGASLTVYGAGAKINVNKASDDVLKSVMRGCASTPPLDTQLEQCLESVEFLISRGSWTKAKAFKASSDACGVILETECNSARVTTSSATYDILSTGLVGTSSVTVHAVLDFSSGSSEGSLKYWRVD
jgi:type II secretory pathway component PulK